MPLPSDLAEVPSIANILINPLFTDLSNTRNVQLGASAALTAAVLDPLSELITGTQINATTSRILLGTFNFTAGLINDEVTHLLATDFNTVNPSSNENTVFNSSTFAALDLDSLFRPGTATITTIPEPSTFVGLLLLGLASWYVGKLLRRKNLCWRSVEQHQSSRRGCAPLRSTKATARNRGGYLLVQVRFLADQLSACQRAVPTCHCTVLFRIDMPSTAMAVAEAS